MVYLCFVLDLRSLSLPLLRDLKQSLLQLANYYAVSCSKINSSDDRIQTNSKPLLDRIGLCYVSRNRISCSDELKIAYNPHGNFNLRDLHHALNNLPIDAFSPESNGIGALSKDLKLADVLSDKIVYAWEGYDKNVARKVILISSCLVDSLDSVTMKALMDAGEKCVSVDFVFVEKTSSHLSDISEHIDHFRKQIASLKNCSFQTCVPDLQVLLGLAKRWFQELKGDMEEPLQAHFVFKTNLISTTNQISCNLHKSLNPVGDEFISCQTCRCHGIPLNHSNTSQTKSSSTCSVTNEELGALDVIENSVKVGKQTLLYMPSFLDSQKLQKVSSPINFNVIQRTNLGSLSEGLIMGATYFVTPSTSSDSDDSGKSELNSQLFQVVCSVLNSLDQGLICSSNCNIETEMETSFRCYYILLPSDKGLMLLRRLAASEEVLPMPDVGQFISSALVEEFKNTVQASLLKLEANDYNPIKHERGFHKKLNLLVKESLQWGATLPKSKEKISDPQSSPFEIRSSIPASETVITGDNTPHLDMEEKNKTSQCLAEEWEQLIVTELGVINSPTCNSRSKLDQMVTSSSENNRQLDEKTSSILERLENPRQLKRKVVSPTTTSSVAADVCGPVKKPLIPYGPTHAADLGPISSQPIKPNFQRMKRKR